jgi:FixJ family two-component response regulator
MNGVRKHYVAVVDDDESVARAYARLLRSAGYEPIAYNSAEAYLEDDKHPRFECLVLDFQLNGISGLELARRLAAVKDPTPVLLLTARDNPEDRAAAKAAGCAGYFRKTDLGSDILETIRNIIERPKTPRADSGPAIKM